MEIIKDVLLSKVDLKLSGLLLLMGVIGASVNPIIVLVGMSILTIYLGQYYFWSNSIVEESNEKLKPAIALRKNMFWMSLLFLVVTLGFYFYISSL